jgi:hypothetical protein
MPDVRRRALRFGLALAVTFGLGAASVAGAMAASEADRATLHYAPNRNFDEHGNYVPARAGFNLADVNSVAQLESLPPGVKGLVWIGQCNGADATFVRTVSPYAGRPKLFGFYLMDDPDPRPFAAARENACRPDALRDESDWIHDHIPGAVTFIVAMNHARVTKRPWFGGGYTPENSHVDLFGLDPYPCRSELGMCDLHMIDSYIEAAERAGIPRQRVVPVFQAFGGGTWKDSNGGRYLLPDPEQLRAMLERWRSLIPEPRFDYAYSWGTQRGDQALESAPALQQVLKEHNESH